LMCRGVDSANTLRALIERSDVIAAGPGLGQDDWAQAMWSCVMTAQHPLVLDADALNLLARAPPLKSEGTRILTPHPAEAGRLLGIPSAEIQVDRLDAARLLADRYEAVAVLKGACSIVTSPGSLPQICDRGNPGMAAAGMGDVLTGVIAGLMAQLQDALKAAQIGVWVHAAAGDRAAAKRGERGLIASDLFEYLGACVNPTANF
jgi:ADP-dependent NAD(P)H-hydrate dehydratase / NAD(P)H-hydrate epimerase